MTPSFLFYLLMVSLRMLWVDKSYINFVQRKKYLTFAKLIATLRMYDANVIFIQIHCRCHKKEKKRKLIYSKRQIINITKGEQRKRDITTSVYFSCYTLSSMQLCHWHSANGVAPILLARLAGFDLTASKHQGRRPRVRKVRAIAAQHKDDGGDVRSLIGVILHAEQCNVDASQDLSNRARCSYHWIDQLRSLVFVPLPPCLKMFVSKHQAATQYECEPCLFRWVPSNYGYRTDNVLTYPAIFKESSWQWKLTALFPVMISKIRTPKP